MTRAELQLLSEANAVAHQAMVVHETGKVPLGAAEMLEKAALVEMPAFAVPCTVFRQRLRFGRHDFVNVIAAGRDLRNAVARAMAYVPPDAHRVDIHG